VPGTFPAVVNFLRKQNLTPIFLRVLVFHFVVMRIRLIGIKLDVDRLAQLD